MSRGKLGVEEVRKNLTAKVLQLSLQLCFLEEAHAYQGGLLQTMPGTIQEEEESDLECCQLLG